MYTEIIQCGVLESKKKKKENMFMIYIQSALISDDRESDRL